MENIKKGTPKDVFLHLLAVLTLYVSVVAFIALWWNYIDVLFPDLLKYQNYYGGYSSYVYDPIRLAMATLIIVFPIHILISWLIGRDFKTDQSKREVRVRKWLWFITLFVSAVTIIVDLIILVNNFLKGDLTAQFFLKVLVVLAVAGAVFGYYLWDLKHREKHSGKPKLIAWIVSAAILASIVYGFFLIGTPSSQRARRFDEQRINNLSVLQSEIISYWQQKAKLPTQLSDLTNQISGFVPPTDPESGLMYEYAVEEQLTFKLCADFSIADLSYQGNGSAARAVPVAPGGYYPYQQNWSHDKGHVCFERTIDPQIYKQNNSGEPVLLKF